LPLRHVCLHDHATTNTDALPDQPAPREANGTVSARVVMEGPSDVGLSARICPATLPRLLVRLGPAVAGGLCRQMAADLHDLRKAMAGAMEPPLDLVALARQAHVLASLAGTAGGHAMEQHARALHRAAHRGDFEATRDLMAGVLPGIDDLVAFVIALPLPADHALTEKPHPA
jgi:hypothetical protein